MFFGLEGGAIKGQGMGVCFEAFIKTFLLRQF